MTKKKNKIGDKKNKDKDASKKGKQIKSDSGFGLNLKSDVKRGIAIVLLVLLAILFGFGFLGSGGVLGNFLNKIAGTMFGWGKWLFPLAMLLTSGILLQRKSPFAYTMKIAGLSVVFLSLLGFLHIFHNVNDFLALAKHGQAGGYIGYLVAKILVALTGKTVGIIVLLTFSIIGAMIAFNFSVVEFVVDFFKKIISQKKSDKQDSDKEKKDDNDKEDTTDKSENVENFAKNVLLKNEQNEKESLLNKNGDVENNSDKQEEEDNIKNIKFVDGPSDGNIKNGEDPFAEYQKGDLNPFAEKKPTKERVKKNTVKPKKTLTDKSSVKNDGEWKLPPMVLLNKEDGKDIYSGNVEDNIRIIKETFSNFGITLEDGGVKIGPTVTQYSFRPAVGVKLSKIVALGDDLALALAKHPIRIEAPIPGKSLIGIEVPNEKGILVNLRRILESDVFKENEGKLPLALGKDVEGELIVEDLGTMPHLLIAGATGTGKSVCINSIILSLLFRHSPEDLKMILVDPKRVELSLYNKIPHLLSDVITDNKRVINALNWAIREMEDRYKILESVGSRDLESYNIKLKNGEKRTVVDPDTGENVEEPLKKMPFIVIIIDELADLMATHGREVEGAIIRLAQMARAVGIHLIISTQRPSVEIITGLIKANITTRIALQVATQVDSRTILDMRGAENLLGKGDMLFLSSESPKPKRIQIPFVSESEVKRVVKFIKDQAKHFQLDEKEDEEVEFENVVKNEKNDDNLSSESNVMKTAEPAFNKIDFADSKFDKKDDLYEEAEKFVRTLEKVSASLLQRRFRIGYNRAARIMEELEEAGIVSEQEGQKPRDVLIGNNTEKQQESSDDISYEDPQKDQEKRDKWQM